MFSFEYRLIGKGWAQAVISDGTEATVLTASYLSDALRHLVESAAIVVEGAAEARCSSDEERASIDGSGLGRTTESASLSWPLMSYGATNRTRLDTGCSKRPKMRSGAAE